MALTVPTISTTGTLSASGVGSGLDVKGLISQLMAVEQRPLTLLATQEAKYQAKLSSLGSIKGALSSLQTAAQSLATASTASYSASVSDSAVLTATGSSSAVAGNYSVSVDGTKLAQGQKLVAPGKASSSTAIGASVSSTLKIELGTNVYTGALPATGFTAASSVNVTIDSSNNTLAGIRNAINAANTGVTVSIINDGGDTPYRLSLASNATGAASSMRLSVTGDANIATLLDYDPTDATPTFTETQAAQNATFTVDGVTITSATNTVTDAIPGVTLKLANKTGINTVTVAVERTGSALSSALNALVSAYNSANTTIASATAKGAVMQGEGGVLNLQRQVRNILGSAQQTGGAYTTLSQLGISFQTDGSLKLDSTKLNTALSASLVDVSSLAGAIGTALKTAADSMLGTTGPITSKTESLNRSITDIGSRRTYLQDRLAVTQARYQKQFSGLDTLIASMNKTSEYLTQQLANLPGAYTGK